MSIQENDDDIITQQEEIIEATENVLEKMRDLLDQADDKEMLIAEQERMIADRNEYIEQLTSSRNYLDLLVVILFSYLYGAWFGVYMCPK